MKCTWAWIFLGRHDRVKGKWASPAPFKFANDQNDHGLVPAKGDFIVLTKKKFLMVNGYRKATEDAKCARKMEPPPRYEDDTAHEFISGTLDANTEMMVRAVKLLPSDKFEPPYVWALVGESTDGWK